MLIRESMFIWAKSRKAMKWYSRSRSDFLELLYSKYKNMEDYTREDPWCLTLSEDMADARDFLVWEAIELDTKVKLPNSFSLWEWIYTTNYQNWWGSCTANSTSHWMQILQVKNRWKKPDKENIVTPSWRDLWSKMGHDLNNKNDSWDYVEKAVNTALKEWISNEEWWVSKFDWYAYWEWARNDKGIDTMKRYLFQWMPIVRCLRWNKTTWNELTAGELKTEIPVNSRTWGHAVCLVGWDESWFRFVNSWRTNDWKGFKSRFHVSYQFIKSSTMFNWRYRVPYLKEQAKTDPEYLKRKNNAVLVLKALKKMYPEEESNVQKAIEQLSREYRKNYPEINTDLPLN